MATENTEDLLVKLAENERALKRYPAQCTTAIMLGVWDIDNPTDDLKRRISLHAGCSQP